ncbi:MAG: hydrogenase nickel incorporation protein HypA [Sulfolobales archaeon]
MGGILYGESGMHEWALAEAVGLALSSYSKQSGIKKFRRLVIGLGELQSIDREILELALGETLKLYGLEVVEFEFITEEASFECRSCGFKWKLGDLSLSNEVREAIHFLPEATYAYVKCPKCGSPDYSITSGRGLSILGVEY